MIHHFPMKKIKLKVTTLRISFVTSENIRIISPARSKGMREAISNKSPCRARCSLCALRNWLNFSGGTTFSLSPIFCEHKIGTQKTSLGFWDQVYSIYFVKLKWLEQLVELHRQVTRELRSWSIRNPRPPSSMADLLLCTGAWLCLCRCRFFSTNPSPRKGVNTSWCLARKSRAVWCSSS